jgi:hypothetical protein
MALGGNDGMNGTEPPHSDLPEEAASRTARIIPLRPMPGVSAPAAADESLVRFAEDGAPPVLAKIAEPPPAAPALREEAREDAKATPGATVVIEQQVPAPPLVTNGDRNGGGSGDGGGGGGGGGGSSRRCTSAPATTSFATCSARALRTLAAIW